MPARILVLRHGQSTWNAEGRWQGHADPPLSNLGTQQAKAAAQLLGAFDAVVASDLERARHTAEIIAAELGIGPLIVDPALRERSAGEWEGLTKPQIEEQFPGWLADRRTPDGWENDEIIVDRATVALAQVAATIGTDGGTALVVSHGGVLRALAEAAGGSSQKTSNLSGWWFEIEVGRFAATEFVELLDDPTRPDET